MKIELMDQPILIVKSSSPAPTSFDSQQDTLKQIENLLQEEIHEIRDRIDSHNEEVILSEYFTDFNLHFQTDKEVVSVVLESEWQEQTGDELNLASEDNPDSMMDLQVSKLMRVLKVSYSEDLEENSNKNLDPADKHALMAKQRLNEKKKILKWVIEQNTNIPLISGLGKDDYLLISASDIINSMGQLRKHLAIE